MVAHVMSMFRRAIRGRMVRINQVGVDELASLTTEQLLNRLRDHLKPQGLATTFRGRLALLDITIHHQDIRRPLGMPRQIPAERLRWVLAASVCSPELPAWHLTRGVRLAPTDLDWTHGSGPEVTGQAEAVLMAITGRRSEARRHRGADRPRAAGAGRPACLLTAPLPAGGAGAVCWRFEAWTMSRRCYLGDAPR